MPLFRRRIQLIGHGTLEREAPYLQFTIQQPGDSIYTVHLLTHAVLTLNSGSPAILSR